MPIFKDTSGKEWTVAIDAPTIMAVREAADPEFMKGDIDATFSRLESDPVVLCNVIYAICRGQAATAGVAMEAFYLRVIGDTIDAATEALQEAILSFIPRRQRELMTLCAAKTNKVRELGLKLAVTKISDPDLEQKVVDELERRLDGILAEITNPTTSPSSASSSPAS